MRGSDTTAAGGGKREWNEWQWSKFREPMRTGNFGYHNRKSIKLWCRCGSAGGKRQSTGLSHSIGSNPSSAPKRKDHNIILFYNPDGHMPTSLRMRSHGHGFSHGLKIARPLSIFAPVRTLVPPFRIPIRGQKKKHTRMGVLLFLAEDEGFEPPQTESESGVLPLHKSSKRNDIIIRNSF